MGIPSMSDTVFLAKPDTQGAQIVFAFTPNSAAAERVFSMLKAMFGDQQMETLADIIQTALMLRINQRKVG